MLTQNKPLPFKSLPLIQKHPDAKTNELQNITRQMVSEWFKNWITVSTKQLATALMHKKIKHDDPVPKRLKKLVKHMAASMMSHIFDPIDPVSIIGLCSNFKMVCNTNYTGPKQRFWFSMSSRWGQCPLQLPQGWRLSTMLKVWCI